MTGRHIASTGRHQCFGWPLRPCKGSALGVGFVGLLVALLTAMVAIGGSGQAAPETARHTIHGPIHGTIAKIDAPRLTLSLRADDGRHMDLITANVDAVRRLREGDHVRVELDDHGIALNINKTALAPRPIFYSRG